MVAAVDEFVARKLGPTLEGSAVASDELRIAAAEALSVAAPAARATAARLIFNALAKGDAMMALARGGRAGPNAMVAYARAAMVLAPADARDFVIAKAEKSSEPQRSMLLALLK
jgi:hypothetical protein